MIPAVRVFLILAVASLADSPRNIILMISDGCGFPQIQATNLYMAGKPHGVQSYERFPVTLWVSTFSASGDGYDGTQAERDHTYVDNKPTDSAASGTAYATGKKTYDAALGVDPDSIPLVNATQMASLHGRSSGVVTTVQFSHATPASMVVHNVSRKNYSQIAREMLAQSGLDVIMGAGHPEYDDDNAPSDSLDYQYVGGKAAWERLKSGTLAGPEGRWVLIESKEAFDSLAHGKGQLPSHVVGVPEVHTTLQMRRSGVDSLDQPFADSLNVRVPDLATMSLGALRVLSSNRKGFFLMIEGGAIDWAGHDNISGRMIEEEVDFSRAVDSVIAWIKRNGGWENNLLVVTADHETGHLEVDTTQPIPGRLPPMKWGSGKHTNQLIPLFAKGKGSQELVNLADQTDPVRGRYLDNTEVGSVLLRHLASP